MRIALALALLSLPLTGCERNPDPSQAGFFSGLGNLATGTYERRVEDKRQELSEAERLKQQFAAREQASRAEREQTAWELIAWRKRVDALDGEIRQLETQMAVLKTRRGAADPRVADAQRKLDAVKRARQSMPAQDGPSAEAQQRLAEQERAVGDALRLVSRPE
jgi:chromosome segregation ATPase